MKKIVCLYMLLLAMILSTSCTLFLGGKGKNDSSKTEENNNDGLINYNFKVSKFPYDSVGLTVKIYSKTGETENPVQVLGTITSAGKNDYIQKTVRLPAQIDLMYVYFETSYNSKKYYLKVLKDEVYDSANDLYDIDGYYNCYYEYYYYTSDPFCGAGEANIREAEFDKQYEYKWLEHPYLLFSFSGMKDKTIMFKTESVKNAKLYYSYDMEKILTYKASYYNDTQITCEEDVVYFMIRPNAYNYDKEDYDVTYKITFIDLEATLKRCLRIDEKAFFASDGKLYVPDWRYSKSLYSINISTNEVTLVKEFDDGTVITYIGEIQSGTLLVGTRKRENSQDIYQINKINLTTKEITSTTNVDDEITDIVAYKNNKYIVFGDRKVFLMNSNVVIEYEINYLDHFYNEYMGGKDFYFIPDADLFIYSSSLIPTDLRYIGFKGSIDSLEFYSHDSQYHGDYSYDTPNRLFNSSTGQFITTTGDIFDIDIDLILNTDTALANQTVNGSENAYYVAIRNWCLHNEDIKGKRYKDCYVTDEYIYYMYNDFSPVKCHVEKCSKQAPQVVLDSIEYERQEGKQFFHDGNKLRLIANSSTYITYDNYPVYIHEINF